MIENLVALVATAPELMASERLLAECRTFVRRKDGSPSAAPGAHDDCVMAMAIAQQLRSMTAADRRCWPVLKSEQDGDGRAGDGGGRLA